MTIIVALFMGCNKKKVQSVDQIIQTQDLQKIKQRAESEKSNMIQLQADIAKLEAEIAKLDTTIKTYPLVTVLSAQDTVFNHYVEVQGNVMTKNDVQIYPEYSGVMNVLHVQEGQYVSKGALVATIDDGGLEQQITQQRIQLSLAKTTYDRQASLWEQNIGSEMQYLSAKNAYESLQEGISALEKQLKKRFVYAPFSGYVETVITKQGQVVSPATPILRLIGTNTLYLEAEVPENYLPTVQKGTKAMITLDAIQKEYETRVKRVNNTINPANRSFLIELNVPNDRLIKPNLIANVKLNDYTNTNAILLPESVINQDAAGNSFVFILDQLLEDGVYQVKQQQVSIGKSTEEGYLEITEGIIDGVKVIEEGAKTLSNGEQVKLVSNTK